MFLTAIFIEAPHWKPPKCPQQENGLTKCENVLTATVHNWVNFKNIMLVKEARHTRTHAGRLPLYKIHKPANIMRAVRSQDGSHLGYRLAMTSGHDGT